MKVLVVDSEPLVLRVFEKMLTADGHAVRVLRMAEGGDAKQAVRLAGEADVVLLGIVMTGCDGPMLASSIRRQFPGIRIVVSSTLIEAGEEMVRIGAVDTFLPQPFAIDELRAAIYGKVAPNTKRENQFPVSIE